MSLLYKKCEVCGTKINKLQSIWNIYLLKTGRELKCPNCETLYKTEEGIYQIGGFYTRSGISLFVWLLMTHFIDSFGLKLGGEVWLYSFIILSLLEFIIMLIIPLKKIEDEKKDKECNK